MRLVLDTSVVVAALRSPAGASAELLRLARTDRVRLLASVPLALEYEAQCLEPRHRRAAGLSTVEVRRFIDAVVAMAEPVSLHYLWRPQLRDAGDEMVLEAAINGRAGALVSFNRRDFGDAPARFGIALLSPSETLRRLS